MRRVASVLGVHVGGLYYHVADKAALLRAMADEMCGRILAALGTRRTDRRLARRRARAVYGRAGDAARPPRRLAPRLLAAAPLTGSLAAMELMDRLVALLDEELDPSAAILAGDALMSYVTGFTLQEALATPPTFPTSVDDLATRFPRLFRDDGTRTTTPRSTRRSTPS